MTKKFTGKWHWGIIVTAGVCLLLFVYLCLYTVNAGEYVIITSMGKPVAIRKEPGLYIKLPTPISIVNRIDKRLQLYQTNLIEYLTKDKKNVIMRTYVCWRIADPLLFFQSVHDNKNAEQKLDDIVCSNVGSMLGDHEMNQFISTDPEQVILDELSYGITKNCRNRAQMYGIEVVDIGFSRLALPEDNTRSVYRRMIAERSAIANEYRALGRQKAAEIRAQADREKSDILAEAYKQAEITKGEGDALAADIYGQAYSKAPEFFKFIRTLEADKKILKSKTTVVLSSDSELIQALKPRGSKKR